MEITLKRLGQDFLAILFPSKCNLCGGPIVYLEPFICTKCFIMLPRERNYNGIDNDTVTRLKGLFTFGQAYSFLKFSKKGAVQRLIHKAKYGRQPGLAFQLGQWMAHEVLWTISNGFDIIVPIPIHRDKLKSRGYNQSAEIAKGIGKVTSKPIVEVLARKSQGVTQTQLNRWDRFENTLNDFSLTNACQISEKRVLLVDDIITTGATLAGATRPLTAHNAKGIIVAAIGLAQRA